ncbi:MAG: type II toxin-antitoxin system HicB family antitoxin [Candidatus Curtissbacteria bacterium]|nr:type II toxin-antitoxin system HicB family antitoxin [Candidatus Curtissbacteria bacterium]
MKNQKVKKVLKYTVVFEPAEEGGYVASVPALPGCLSQGESFEETTKMIKDAISGYLTVLKEKGQEIPKESEEVIISKVEVFQPSV